MSGQTQGKVWWQTFSPTQSRRIRVTLRPSAVWHLRESSRAWRAGRAGAHKPRALSSFLVDMRRNRRDTEAEDCPEVLPEISWKCVKLSCAFSMERRTWQEQLPLSQHLCKTWRGEASELTCSPCSWLLGRHFSGTQVDRKLLTTWTGSAWTHRTSTSRRARGFLPQQPADRMRLELPDRIYTVNSLEDQIMDFLINTFRWEKKAIWLH